MSSMTSPSQPDTVNLVNSESPPAIVHVLPASEQLAPFRGLVLPRGFDYKSLVNYIGYTPHFFGHDLSMLGDSFFDMFYDHFLTEEYFAETQNGDGRDPATEAANDVMRLVDTAYELIVALNDPITTNLDADADYYIQEIVVDACDNLHVVCIPTG